MAVNTVDFLRNQSADTDRAVSPAIWADCPMDEIRNGKRNGIFFRDDFVDMPLIGTQTTQIGFGKYKVFNTGSGTVSRISTINSVEIPGGAATITLDTDNDSGTLAQAYPSFMLTGLTSNSGKLWFEACFAQNSVATNMAAGFIGLAEVEQWTLATAVPFNASDAITNAAAAIGFRIEEDGLGVIDTVYSDRATSFTNIGDTEGGTLTAFGFRKLGMVYDPHTDDPSRMLQFYANNLVLSTALSGTALRALTNLDANALGLIWSHCADSAGTSFAAYMKWWQCVQLFEPKG